MGYIFFNQIKKQSANSSNICIKNICRVCKTDQCALKQLEKRYNSLNGRKEGKEKRKGEKEIEERRKEKKYRKS